METYSAEKYRQSLRRRWLLMMALSVSSLALCVVNLVMLFVDKKVAGGILIASLLFMTASNIQYTIWQKKLSEEDMNDEA